VQILKDEKKMPKDVEKTEVTSPLYCCLFIIAPDNFFMGVQFQVSTFQLI
jgi:hypothetical protein